MQIIIVVGVDRYSAIYWAAGKFRYRPAIVWLALTIEDSTGIVAVAEGNIEFTIRRYRYGWVGEIIAAGFKWRDIDRIKRRAVPGCRVYISVISGETCDDLAVCAAGQLHQATWL